MIYFAVIKTPIVLNNTTNFVEMSSRILHQYTNVLIQSRVLAIAISTHHPLLFQRLGYCWWLDNPIGKSLPKLGHQVIHFD